MNQKSYYTAQESAYKKIRENGEAGWMRKTIDDFRDFETDKIIKDYVVSYFTSTIDLTALDLGTGTGSTAHTLYDLGFKVTGIDVCPSAIDSAKEIATREKKDIRFDVADVLELNSKFDLIYDSHCAHCVVLLEDRAKFFSSIHASLKENGIFILDSMALKQEELYTPDQGLRFDENFILWHKTKGETHTGVVKIDEIFWCPQRRIYPAEKLLSELKQHGFRIITYSLDEQEKGEPCMLRALCTKH